MSPAPARVPARILSAAALLLPLLFFAAPSAAAGFLERFIGNTRAKNAAGNFDSTIAFAVLERCTETCSPGDVFGTGRADFDTEAVTTPMGSFDTTAQYLYLYQDVNDGIASDSLSGVGFSVFGTYALAVSGVVTSVAHWDLVLSDDAGPFSASNQFGQDDATFQADAYAIRGGINDPGIASPGPGLASHAFVYDDLTGILSVTYDPPLGQGEIGPLYGFTSNLPPAYFIPVDTPAGVASGEFPVVSVTGGFLGDFIGNTRARNSTMPPTRDESWSFAVLDQLSSASAPGDVFGTGIPTFDADTGIDTTARFLYLYQDINDGTLTDPVTNVHFVAPDTQPVAPVDLVFTDDGGEFTSTNQFGTDGAPHEPQADASIGVHEPGLTEPSVTLAPAGITYDGQNFEIIYNGGTGLAPGEIGPLYGFTSNRRPIYAKPFGNDSNAVDGDTPVPLPEPSTELMLVIAAAALLIRRRFAATRPRPLPTPGM